MKQPKCLQMLPNVWEENRVPILVFILFLWQIQHVINQVCMGERHLMPLLFPPAAASGQMPFTASSILLTQGPLCRSSLLTTGEKWSLIPLRPYSRSRLGRFVLTVAARGPHHSLPALNPGLEQRDKCLIPSSESPVAQDSIHHARLLLRWGGPQQELGCWLRK